MANIMYVHGYGSNCHATKGRLLKEMLSECNVITPTLDYNEQSPFQLLEQLRQLIDEQEIKMIVGSSLGGYFTLCSTLFFDGPVWLLNPVRQVEETLRRIIASPREGQTPLPTMPKELAEQKISEYADFDREVFHRLPTRQGQLHFALSTDDALLGDHHELLSLFPHYAEVVWKDRCGHTFLRFSELQENLRQTLASIR